MYNEVGHACTIRCAVSSRCRGSELLCLLGQLPWGAELSNSFGLLGAVPQPLRGWSRCVYGPLCSLFDPALASYRPYPELPTPQVASLSARRARACGCIPRLRTNCVWIAAGLVRRAFLCVVTLCRALRGAGAGDAVDRYLEDRQLGNWVIIWDRLRDAAGGSS